MTIPNSTYIEALSTATANYSKDIADNISNNNALLAYIKKNGNVTTFDSGTEILQNISYPGNSPGGWFSGAETLDVSASDSISSAQFAIKQAYGSVVFTGLDEMIHSGSSAKHDFFKAKIKNAEMQLQNLIGTSLFYSNTENSGKSIGGLQHLVSDLGTGTVGGIDSSSQTWWKNYVHDVSALSETASATTILGMMNDVYMNTTFGVESPDLIIAGSTYFGYFESAMQDKQMFTSADVGKAGFNGYRYKNAFVTFDANCAATRMYFLNTNYIHFRPHVKKNFVTQGSKDSVNQDAYVIPIFWGGNMTVSGRKYQGILVA